MRYDRMTPGPIITSTGSSWLLSEWIFPSVARKKKKKTRRLRRLFSFPFFFFVELLCPYLATNLQEVTESSSLSRLIVAVPVCLRERERVGFERVPNAWRRMGARRDRRGRGTGGTDRHKASARHRHVNKDAHKGADRRRQRRPKALHASDVAARIVIQRGKTAPTSLWRRRF